MARPVAEKLQIKPGRELLVVGTPDQHALLEPLPDGVRTMTDGAPPSGGVAVLFTADRVALDEHVETILPRLSGVRAVWVAYPKANRTDINRDSIWRRAEEIGWTATANVALDDGWSAVRIKPVS
ncbi:DUF3052 domain-containing protein [Ornithinimicrobium sp. F0845]|uniref:DUF3052 domain-containing protein n=1 Tax=Ornithinimicrobium sp. F0845 TaxID=2926412 RepID=UPI001FF47F25|nr:DUF3052 domain-containing protein [Ornithinimicrobium sp. F0845]MCK0112251.1 DUF3052 domain-containing protein [Ornithinimicrobium sp. F0845]